MFKMRFRAQRLTSCLTTPFKLINRQLNWTGTIERSNLSRIKSYKMFFENAMKVANCFEISDRTSHLQGFRLVRAFPL